MKPNSFGERFLVTTFGESHGPALGCVVDGCPAGVVWDEKILMSLLRRRRPGKHQNSQALVSGREEKDSPEILSGVFEGKTLGTPIALMVKNTDARSEDYSTSLYRAGHADDVWQEKFGHRDHRGGGRSSGRETLSRVLGGAVAQMLLKEVCPDLEILSYVSRVGPIEMSAGEHAQVTIAVLTDLEFPFPSLKREQVQQLLLDAKEKGESYGGTAHVVIQNVPKFLGEPVFRKLKSDLASSFMSLGAVCAVELGDGVSAGEALGTEFHREFQSENYGGLRGGISTGEKMIFRVHFKPTASVMDVAKKGRHDPCIVPRALPVLESMLSLVLADQLLMRATNQVSFLK